MASWDIKPELHPGHHLPWWLLSLRATHCCLFGTWKAHRVAICKCWTLRPAIVRVHGSSGTRWHREHLAQIDCNLCLSHAFDFFLALKFPHLQGKTAEDIFMVSTLNSDEALETQEMKKQTKRPGRKSSKQSQRTDKCQNTFSWQDWFVLDHVIKQMRTGQWLLQPDQT